MNILRHHGRTFKFLRTYAARPFIPPAQLLDVRHDPRRNWRTIEADRVEEKLDHDDDDIIAEGQVENSDRMFSDVVRREKTMRKPASPSFYTGNSVFYDNLTQLQTTAAKVRGTLKDLDLLPLPDFALASLTPMRPIWKGIDELDADFHNQLTGKRHRSLVVVLDELFHYYRIATTAGYEELAGTIEDILDIFQSGKKREQLEAQSRRKKVTLDSFGRSYTVGKRKTSSARVWMIPVHNTVSEQQPPSLDQELNDIFGTSPKSSEYSPSDAPISYKPTTILVNNIPLAQYFPIPTDRERIVRPLKIARVLGKFNIFAIVRGGGTTGQSGALSHGIAKGIVAHDPKSETVLKKAKLTRRDPRMVERKKTGLAKARKAYTWVRR